MLVFIVLATLLCSSLLDARLAPLNTSEALELCRNQDQPSCNNPALEISPETSFHPKVIAPPSGAVNLAVKSKEPLSFSVSPEKVEWELKRPGADCSWLVTSTGSGLVEFVEKKAGETIKKAMCDGDTKRVVTIAVAISGTVEVSGGCNTPGTLNLACEYAAPDSVTIPDWDIWALTISSTSDPIPGMTFKNAYVVYEAPEPTTTTSPGGSTDNTNGRDNATEPIKSGCATPDANHGNMVWFIIIGVCGLIILTE